MVVAESRNPDSAASLNDGEGLLDVDAAESGGFLGVDMHTVHVEIDSGHDTELGAQDRKRTYADVAGDITARDGSKRERLDSDPSPEPKAVIAGRDMPESVLDHAGDVQGDNPYTRKLLRTESNPVIDYRRAAMMQSYYKRLKSSLCTLVPRQDPTVSSSVAMGSAPMCSLDDFDLTCHENLADIEMLFRHENVKDGSVIPSNDAQETESGAEAPPTTPKLGAVISLGPGITATDRRKSRVFIFRETASPLDENQYDPTIAADGYPDENLVNRHDISPHASKRVNREVLRATNRLDPPCLSQLVTKDDISDSGIENSAGFLQFTFDRSC
ncbi:hypothetical protein SeLEV6574_g05380 [Synchytrium endobioticum]|uniref:Uncharacterized protein n=1 Tax=Synchytrium endobioticum TaxID=286115 RepID=A0A507CUS0_9FUNG|nr:hypothetical protein SeLEV6574_g05380 [Synchytrium endobioticum]